jgi:hypothetical protein
MEPWLQMLSPWTNIRLPASGDVRMDYSPWTNWGWSASVAGDPDVERELFTTVALPGKQLGKLTDIVTILLKLAEQTHKELEKDDPEQAIKIREFKKMVSDIQVRKEQIKQSAEEDANNALDRLKIADHSAFDRLIDRAYRDKNRHSQESTT